MAGCDHESRIVALEKESKELKENVKRSSAAGDFDLSSKCSDRAKVWVRENFPADKDTITLTGTNHFSHSRNACYVLVEWHYSLDKNGSWANHMSLWNVNENDQYADFSQNHVVNRFDGYKTEDRPPACEVTGKRCRSIEEFNSLAEPYLTN